MHDKLVIANDAIVLTTSTGRVMKIELGKIADAEQRIQDISHVTPSKAPELLGSFTVAWQDLDKLVSFLNYEHQIAQDKVRNIRAVLLIETVQGVVKAKGLPNTKDSRDAILDTHPEAMEAEETVHEIKCVLELIKGKRESVGMAYTAVKRCMGEGAYNMLGNKPNHNLSTPLETNAEDSPFGSQKY